MINSDFIRTFLVLAETKHFTKTAELRRMTQPGVSQHLKKLEEHFGVALVRKEGKSFTLTESGRRLVDYGKRLFDDHRKFRESVKEDDPYAGPCRFASPGSFAFRVFDTCLDLAERHRSLRVEVLVAPNASIVEHLRTERVDVGFMSEEPKGQSIEYELFDRERLLLVLPKGKRPTSFEALRKLGYVNHPDGFHYAERLLARNYPEEFSGMETFPVSAFINQISRILDPVARGLGFTILPETACERYHRRGAVSLVALPKTEEDPIYKVVRRGDNLPSRYVECLRRMRK